MTKSALFLFEEAAIMRVVHIDGVLVGKLELEISKDAFFSRRLGKAALADVNRIPVDVFVIGPVPSAAYL